MKTVQLSATLTLVGRKGWPWAAEQGILPQLCSSCEWCLCDLSRLYVGHKWAFLGGQKFSVFGNQFHFIFTWTCPDLSLPTKVPPIPESQGVRAILGRPCSIQSSTLIKLPPCGSQHGWRLLTQMKNIVYILHIESPYIECIFSGPKSVWYTVLWVYQLD